MIYRSIYKSCGKKKTIEDLDQLAPSFGSTYKFFCLKLLNCQGELKKPFENKNKHIRSKGPTPNTKRTIFAVLGVVFFSTLGSIILVVTFLLDFLLGIPVKRLK